MHVEVDNKYKEIEDTYNGNGVDQEGDEVAEVKMGEDNPDSLVLFVVVNRV